MDGVTIHYLIRFPLETGTDQSAGRRARRDSAEHGAGRTVLVLLIAPFQQACTDVLLDVDGQRGA